MGESTILRHLRPVLGLDRSARRNRELADGSRSFRALLVSIKTDILVGLRDRAIIAMLVYTAARAGAVSSLKRGSFYHAGEQWMLHFEEKGGKSTEIPVRHDLER